jgi:hypothetical protein
MDGITSMPLRLHVNRRFFQAHPRLWRTCQLAHPELVDSALSAANFLLSVVSVVPPVQITPGVAGSPVSVPGESRHSI